MAENSPDKNADPGSEASLLSHVEHWVFDLDNTLYPSSEALFSEVDQRMGDFIATRLSLSYEDARKVQKEYFHQYGTTLRGLMIHHDVDPHEFLSHVHTVDVGRLSPNPRLDSVLSRIEGHKVIYTNATTHHARNVLERLGVSRHFPDVFDIIAADFIPKPDIRSYHALLARYDIRPEAAVLFEDVPRNLEPARALGMTTVLIQTDHEWSRFGEIGAHIDHVVDNLTDWLHHALPEIVPDPSEA